MTNFQMAFRIEETLWKRQHERFRTSLCCFCFVFSLLAKFPPLYRIQSNCMIRRRSSRRRMNRVFVYLHGFASNPNSIKGAFLSKVFVNEFKRMNSGLELPATESEVLLKPDLNYPSFGNLTISGSLHVIDELYSEKKKTIENPQMYLIGSSLGGYLAARWAEKNPDKVKKMLLMCPACDIHNRWVKWLGNDVMSRWQRDGYLEFPDAKGVLTKVHYGFYEDMINHHPPFPKISCPTLILHGTQDTQLVKLIEVDDGHALTAPNTLQRMEHLVREFFFESSPPKGAL